MSQEIHGAIEEIGGEDDDDECERNPQFGVVREETQNVQGINVVVIESDGRARRCEEKDGAVDRDKESKGVGEGNRLGFCVKRGEKDDERAEVHHECDKRVQRIRADVNDEQGKGNVEYECGEE